MGGLIMECQKRSSDPNWVASGRFRLTIEGAVSTTLKGKATYVPASNETLAFLELETARQDSMGVSVEFSGARLATGALALHPAGLFSSAFQSAGTAFLKMDDLTFQSEEGTVQIESLEQGELKGTYQAIMRGAHEGIEGEEVMVHVRGVFRAEPEEAAER